LKHFDVVNIGAAGTFVVRKPVSRTALRAELMRRLPFEAEVGICTGADILRLISGDPFAGQPSGPDVVRFVSVVIDRPQPLSAVPLTLPSRGKWCVRLLGCQHPFLLGMYRRDMKTIGYLGQLEKLVGVSLTTRNWNTILSIVKVLENGSASGNPRRSFAT
jgi:hypothetical protein